MKTTDPIVESVTNKYNNRSRLGLEKYGTTLEDNNTDDFLKHLQEELMDATLYVEKLMSIASKLKAETEIVEAYEGTSTSIDLLGMSPITSSQLEDANILIVEYLVEHTEEDLLNMEITINAVDEIKATLKERGMKLK